MAHSCLARTHRDDTGTPALLQHAHALQNKAGDTKGIVLGHSAANGVVVKSADLGVFVLCARPAGGGNLGEPVFVTSSKALDQHACISSGCARPRRDMPACLNYIHFFEIESLEIIFLNCFFKLRRNKYLQWDFL